jgi:hypothetical protein
VIPSEPVAVILLVAGVLEELNIPYLIGGSMASAVHAGGGQHPGQPD